MYSIPFRCGASEARTRLIAFNDLEFAQQLKWKAPNESTPTIGVNGCCGMELSMGFGQRLSPNFANRFTFALRDILMRRVDAAEDVIFDAETPFEHRI